MIKKGILFAVILLFIFAIVDVNVFANVYLSDKTETKYDSTSGLLIGKSNSICQTEDGYIWIGQSAGLTRYDSKKFNIISSYNDISLTSVVALASYKNYLLIGTEKGFFIKNEDNIFLAIELTDSNIVVNDIKVYDKYAFVATSKGLYRYDILTEEKIKLNSLNVSKVAIYDLDTYYFIEDEINVYSNKLDVEIESGSFNSINIYQNKLYFGNRTGSIYTVDLKDNGEVLTDEDGYFGYIVDTPLGSNSSINDIIFDGDYIYICSDDGLYTGEFEFIGVAEKAQSKKYDYKKIEKAFIDYENNLWLCSSLSGVYKITQNEIFDYSNNLGLDDATIYAIEKYHDLTFIGSDKGLVVIDESGFEISQEDFIFEDDYYTLVEKRIKQLYNYIGDCSIKDIEIYNDVIYFATSGGMGRLVRFDYNKMGDGNDLSSLDYDDLSNDIYLFDANEGKDFTCLKAVDNYLIIGLDKGISRYDGENILYYETGVNPLYIINDDNDIYVVLNTIGVVKGNVNDFTSFERIDKDNTYSTLKCMMVNDGILFTGDNDLYFYKDDVMTKIGLDFIGSIVDIYYINNKYYVCSESIIYIVDDIFKDDKIIRIIDSSNGIKSSLVSGANGYYDSINNILYLSTSTGIFGLNVNDDHIVEMERKIAINGIYADGKLINGDNITISSETKRLEIDFSVLSFIGNDNYKIYYKLSGYDDDYRVIDSSEAFNIVYQNLEGGKYDFELYLKEFDGTINKNTIKLSITKEKKITEYKSFWVMIAFITSGFIILGFYMFFRNKTKKSIQRQLEYKNITIESIEAIARTIDAKDKYTNGHSKRVGIYSREIAKALNLSPDEIDNIYYIALLHDIGKISISLDILNKPGKLTDEEFEIIKSHTTAGGKILEGITTIPHIVDGAMYHHERYGGGGYPNGLKGEEIPFIARIICCADCYDAMATKRTYKEAYSKEKIISEFERCKEMQFDPKIADVVIELIKEDKLKANNDN